MTFPIRLLPEAKAEFDLPTGNEQKQKGLGIDLIVRVGEVFKRIAGNPRMHPVVYKDVRRALVKKFPYLVLYREDQGEIIVIAVFHTSRNPAVWQSRV
jgi:hypothetical protein